MRREHEPRAEVKATVAAGVESVAQLLAADPCRLCLRECPICRGRRLCSQALAVAGLAEEARCLWVGGEQVAQDPHRCRCVEQAAQHPPSAVTVLYERGIRRRCLTVLTGTRVRCGPAAPYRDRFVGALPGRRRPSGGGSVKKKIASWGGRAAVAALVTAVTAGLCRLSGSGPARGGTGRGAARNCYGQHGAFGVPWSWWVAKWLVAALSRLVTATCSSRGGVFAIVPASTRGLRPLRSARSPAPTTITVPGKPLPPGPGATAYQWDPVPGAPDKTWRSKVKTAKQQAAARTRAEMLAWPGRIGLPAYVDRSSRCLGQNPNSLGDHRVQARRKCARGPSSRQVDRGFSRPAHHPPVCPQPAWLPHEQAELAGDDVDRPSPRICLPLRAQAPPRPNS